MHKAACFEPQRGDARLLLFQRCHLRVEPNDLVQQRVLNQLSLDPTWSA